MKIMKKMFAILVTAVLISQTVSIEAAKVVKMPSVKSTHARPIPAVRKPAVQSTVTRQVPIIVGDKHKSNTTVVTVTR